jgi:hypothetical protein
MQVERYDLRDMKRATRKRHPGYECAPDMGLGLRVGAASTFGDQFLKQGPPVSSGLTHWYKGSRFLTQAVPGTTTTVNATDSVASPGYLVTESPTGVARALLSTTAGSLQHGITRALTGGNEGNTLASCRVWVRTTASPSPTWVYLQLGGGQFRAWFNIANGTVGSVSPGPSSISSRIVQTYVSPNDGFVWYLLEAYDFLYSSGSNGIFITDADGNVAYDNGGAAISIIYDSIQFYQDKVNQWTDLIGTDHLLQAGTAVKPIWVPASPTFQGESSIRTTGSHNVTASTAANWANMHDGTGSSFAVVFQNSQTTAAYDNIFTTNGGSGLATGVSLSYRGDLRRIVWEVGGAGSNKHAIACDFPDVPTAVKAHWCGAALASVNNPDASLWVDGVLIGSSNPSGGYTAGAPATGLQVGGGSAVANEIAELLVWNRALTAAEWALVHYYLKPLHGTA